MDFATAITRVSDGLGFRAGLNAKIILRFQEAQRDLERGKSLPWFLVKEDQTLTIPPNSNSAPLPADFLRFYEEEAPRYLGPDGVTYFVGVQRKPFDAALFSYSQRTAGAPRVFAVRSNSLYFMPGADANGLTLLWSYYGRGTQLVSENDENVWLDNAPDLLIGEAGMRLAADLRDIDAVAVFKNIRDSARDALMREIVAREEDARRRRMGANR